MSNINNRYFLHFLDRELLEVGGLYNIKLMKATIRDTRIIISCTTNTLIIPSAFLFESYYATGIYNKFKYFFEKGKIKVSLSYGSIADMIDSKRQQFKGNEHLFPKYYDESLELYQDKGLFFTHKKSNTTLEIANNMVAILNDEYKEISRIHVPYIIDTIDNRQNKAITHHLFDDLYNKKEFTKFEKRSINSLITDSYIKSYMNFFKASIFCDLSSGINNYDYLDDNFPFSSVLFWSELYERIGVYKFITESDESVFIGTVESDEQIKFLESIQKLIKSYESTQNDIYMYIDKLPNRGEVLINDENAYLKRIMEVRENINSLIENKEKTEQGENNMDEVFVVHGRNEKIKDSLFDFLEAINIKPLEWEEVVRRTGTGTPTTLEVIEKGMNSTDATIILFTGDDLVRLKDEFCENDDEKIESPQARPNVLIEAGMSIALNKEKTVIVCVGKNRRISDLDGINFIKLTNSSENRNAFADRLETIGLNVSKSGGRWLKKGDFS